MLVFIPIITLTDYFSSTAGSITVNTRAVLVNAIHFKNEWKYGFKESDTRSKPFYLSKNKSVAVPIMFLKNRFLYTGNYSYQALEMPYKVIFVNLLLHMRIYNKIF